MGFILVAILLIVAYEAYVNVGGSVATGGPDAGPNFQSPVTIYSLAVNAGFSGADAVTAVAIALAESSGNANAYNPELAAQAVNGAPDGQGSAGLWQIYQFAHPEFAGENLYDPQTNANAAFAVYSSAGNSFTPWATFKALSAGNLATAQSAADQSNEGGGDGDDTGDDDGE
jgi:hypothetical protein